MINGPFAAVLEARRAGFNARFDAARRRTPAISPVEFADHLAHSVAPAVEAVASRDAARVGAVAEVLYDVTLELFAIGLLGAGARYPAVSRGWRCLLPAHAAAVAADPRGTAIAVTNALVNISQVPLARPDRWIDGMLDCAAVHPDSEEFLAAGQVLAWRVGMSHFRQGALERCRELRPALARVVLGLAPDTPAQSASLDVMLARLEDDPWLDPARAELPDQTLPRPTLGLVARLGGFRGFGGVFLRPPCVEPAQEGFLVRDGYQDWLLVADRFGATFHRTAPSPPVVAGNTDDHVFPDGRVRLAGDTGAFPALREARTWATDAARRTLAVTLPHSHAVVLVGRIHS